MPRRPRIAVTVDCVTDMPSYLSSWFYSQAVERAGGLPILLPYRVDPSLVTDYLDHCDGVLLTGGNDLDPTLYGQSWHANAKRTDPHRTAFEMRLLDELQHRQVPVLGICLGAQTMNVHRGGSLIQFLPDIPRPNAIEHRRLSDWTPRHGVELAEHSQVAKCLGKTTLSVNTSHKQAIDRVGRGLQAIGQSPDGIIEAIEDPDHPHYVGVQWHPERQVDEADHLALFQRLIDAASR